MMRPVAARQGVAPQCTRAPLCRGARDTGDGLAASPPSERHQAKATGQHQR